MPRDTKIRIRAGRTKNGMDVWYSDPENRARVIADAEKALKRKRGRSSDLDEGEEDEEDEGDDEDSEEDEDVNEVIDGDNDATTTTKKKKKKPNKLGLCAMLKKKYYDALPPEERQKWESRAAELKARNEAAHESAYKYAIASLPIHFLTHLFRNQAGIPATLTTHLDRLNGFGPHQIGKCVFVVYSACLDKDEQVRVSS